MRRRDLLTTGIGALSAAFAGRAWSAPNLDQRLLVVFLRGGYDAINVVIPTRSDFYYEARPTIAVARPDPANPNAALPLDADWSLHPALAQSIYPLWQKRQVAFVPFAGTDDMTRSHFETQDTIELGQPVGGSRDYRSGFMARLAGQLTGAHPIAFTTRPPLTFHGGDTVPNIAIGSVSKPGVEGRQAELIEQMYKGHALETAVSSGFSVRDRAYASITREMVAANRGASAPEGLELAAQRVARLMKAEYNLAFLDVGGWDTHVNQGGVTGALAGRVGQLGRGLSRLAEDLGSEIWAKTTVIVVSEFGRTFKENGDKGTDHGHGGVYWIMGGDIRGGRMIGDQVRLAPDQLNQGRDLPVLTDYRTLIGNVLKANYGLGAKSLDAVFPNARIDQLRLT